MVQCKSSRRIMIIHAAGYAGTGTGGIAATPKSSEQGQELP
jgi:hypothetical protein